MNEKLENLINSKEFVFLDGAMGTMLQVTADYDGNIPELVNMIDPWSVMNMHTIYSEVGADIVYTNTFGANRLNLADSGYTVEEIVKSAVGNAREGVFGDALIALDIGSVGKKLSDEEYYDIFKEIVLAGKDADLIAIEGMTSLEETKAAVRAVKENSGKPIIVTMSFGENLLTADGVSPEEMVTALESLGVDAIGADGVLSPKQLRPVIEKISSNTSLPVIAKPNAGIPDPETGEYDVEPEEFALHCAKLTELGVKMFGGACGTTPAHIAALAFVFENIKYHPYKK